MFGLLFPSAYFDCLFAKIIFYYAPANWSRGRISQQSFNPLKRQEIINVLKHQRPEPQSDA